MNQLFEVQLTEGDAFYIVAPNRYRANELLGGYLESNRLSHFLAEGKYTIHQVDLGEECVLARGTKCRECET